MPQKAKNKIRRYMAIMAIKGDLEVSESPKNDSTVLYK